jgi:hypothetical protein
MELQRASRLGEGKQLSAQLIVQARQLANGLGRQPLEKAAQTRLIGTLFQPQQGQKETIILKLVGFVDALQTGDQKKQQQLDQVNRIELGPIGSRAQAPLEPTAKIQFVTKSLNQEQAAVMGQGLGLEGKLQ